MNHIGIQRLVGIIREGVPKAKIYIQQGDQTYLVTASEVKVKSEQKKNDSLLPLASHKSNAC